MIGNYILHARKVTQKVKFLLSESLREDDKSLFRGRKILQVDDVVMNQLSNVMHVDLNVSFSLLLHHVFANLQYDFFVTLDDSRTMELDTRLSEEFM
jgi:hypothetical protein